MPCVLARCEAEVPRDRQTVAEEGGMSFHEKYRDLEDRLRALAEADGDVYLPNVEPSGPVRYVFIAMEPSLGAGLVRRRKRGQGSRPGFGTSSPIRSSTSSSYSARSGITSAQRATT
jgi:hypothetical protein